MAQIRDGKRVHLFARQGTGSARLGYNHLDGRTGSPRADRGPCRAPGAPRATGVPCPQFPRISFLLLLLLPIAAEGRLPLHSLGLPSSGVAVPFGFFSSHATGARAVYEARTFALSYRIEGTCLWAVAGPAPETPTVFAMSFVNATLNKGRLEDSLDATATVFGTANGATQARTHPLFASLTFPDAYPGVDLHLASRHGALEYGFRIKPGYSPRAIRMRFPPGVQVTVNDFGELEVRAGKALQYHRRLQAFQNIGDDRVPVSAAFVQTGLREFGFRAGSYDRTRALIIDPALDYAIAIDGSGGERGWPSRLYGMAFDQSGFVYLSGYTYSPDFPVTPNALQSKQAEPTFNSDAVLVKLNKNTGQLVYATYLGGAGLDDARAVGVDGRGQAILAGSTASPNFPLRNAIQTSIGSGACYPLCLADNFFAKLRADGEGLIYSTYLGGVSEDLLRGMRVDPSGYAVFAGNTNSVNLPTTPGAFQRTYGRSLNCSGCYDGFVGKIVDDGQLGYLTYFGGLGSDEIWGVALDRRGNTYITGRTQSPDFPVTPGVIQPVYRGPGCEIQWDCGDAFVSKLDPTGSRLVWSTFLGSAGWDRATAVTVDTSENVFVSGSSSSASFPTTPGTYEPAGSDGFVAKLSPDATRMIWGTRLSSTYSVNGMFVNSSGEVFVVGDAIQRSPIRDPIQLYVSDPPQYCPDVPGTMYDFLPCSDSYVVQLSADGAKLLFATPFGGRANDFGMAVAQDETNRIYLAGHTHGGIPSTAEIGRGWGLFLARIDLGRSAPATAWDSFRDAAGFRNTYGFLAPGGLMTVFGANFVEPGVFHAPGFPLPTELKGLRILIGDTPAPILVAANVNGVEQINFQVPFELPPLYFRLVVERNGVRSLPMWATQIVFGSYPGVFTLGDGTPAIQHSADYSLVTAESPAKPGEVLIAYATGLGKVIPPLCTGCAAPLDVLSRTEQTPFAYFGVSLESNSPNPQAEVAFSGLVPGLAGVYQVNFRVPASAPAGIYQFALSYSNSLSNVVAVPVAP